MIRLSRPSEPPILASQGARWLVELKVANPKQAKTIRRRYGHPQIRLALEAMSHKKCAYCESQILHVTSAHIEHFRPKGVADYADLVFQWDNLFLACPACNTDHKKTQFPLGDSGEPLLIDPCQDEPKDSLTFDLASGRVVGRDRKGRTSVVVLGLNRNDLWERRVSLLEKLKLVARLAARGDPEAKQLLEQAASAKGEYSAFVQGLLLSLTP